MLEIISTSKSVADDLEKFVESQDVSFDIGSSGIGAYEFWGMKGYDAGNVEYTDVDFPNVSVLLKDGLFDSIIYDNICDNATEKKTYFRTYKRQDFDVSFIVSVDSIDEVRMEDGTVRLNIHFDVDIED